MPRLRFGLVTAGAPAGVSQRLRRVVHVVLTGNPAMNYDSWKLASGADRRAEELSDRCCDIEALVDATLKQALARTNRGPDSLWEVEPALAEFDDDGAIFLDLSLRLHRVRVGSAAADLQELSQAFLRLGETLAQLTRSSQTPHGLKLAGSLPHREGGRQAELG